MKWKKIKNFENYSINEIGQVRNEKTQKILKASKSTSGYECLQLVKNKHKYLKYVHRLVAEAFILNNDNNKCQIDHINGNKLDNRIDNLRWVTARENYFLYGYDERILHKQKKIIATNGNKEIVFNSRNECAEHFKCNKSHIEYNKLYKKGNKKGWIFKLKI